MHAPSSICFCNWQSPVIITGTFLGGWISILASALWVALEPVPATHTKLLLLHHCPSYRG
jgi:hypothetical protein